MIVTVVIAVWQWWLYMLKLMAPLMTHGTITEGYRCNCGSLKDSAGFHVTLRYVTLRYVTLRYASLRYVTLRYVTLRYVTLRYATLRYVTLQHYTALNCSRLRTGAKFRISHTLSHTRYHVYTHCHTH